MGERSRAVTAEASLNCQRKALNFIPTFLKAFSHLEQYLHLRSRSSLSNLIVVICTKKRSASISACDP
jgi:hypothetical protein